MSKRKIEDINDTIKADKYVEVLNAYISGLVKDEGFKEIRLKEIGKEEIEDYTKGFSEEKNVNTKKLILSKLTKEQKIEVCRNKDKVIMINADMYRCFIEAIKVESKDIKVTLRKKSEEKSYTVYTSSEKVKDKVTDENIISKCIRTIEKEDKELEAAKEKVKKLEAAKEKVKELEAAKEKVKKANEKCKCIGEPPIYRKVILEEETYYVMKRKSKAIDEEVKIPTYEFKATLYKEKE